MKRRRSTDLPPLRYLTFPGSPRSSHSRRPLAISRMITEESDGRKEYAVAGGLLYFENDLATILTDAIESKEEIDLRRAEEAKQRAEARLDDPNMDMRRAEVALKKAINRISVKNDLK